MSVYNITIQVQQTYNWLCFMNIVPQTVMNMHWNNVYCLIELDPIISFSQSRMYIKAHSMMYIVKRPRFCKRRGTLFKSLLTLLAEEVCWLAVEVLSPYRK